MAKGDYLGEFELVVLLGLARIADEAYGMTIFEEIKVVTGRDLMRRPLTRFQSV